jgi:hypothetical protein
MCMLGCTPCLCLEGGGGGGCSGPFGFCCSRSAARCGWVPFVAASGCGLFVLSAFARRLFASLPSRSEILLIKVPHCHDASCQSAVPSVSMALSAVAACAERVCASRGTNASRLCTGWDQAISKSRSPTTRVAVMREGLIPHALVPHGVSPLTPTMRCGPERSP